jgi:hypothetical protein
MRRLDVSRENVNVAKHRVAKLTAVATGFGVNTTRHLIGIQRRLCRSLHRQSDCRRTTQCTVEFSVDNASVLACKTGFWLLPPDE